MGSMKIKIYKAKDGWRWRMVARNGRIVADSGEAYTRMAACEKAAYRLIASVDAIAVVVPAK